MLTELELSTNIPLRSIIYRNALTTSVLLKASVRMFLKGMIWALTVRELVVSVCEHPRTPLRAATCTWLQLQSLLFKSITNYHMFPCGRPGQGGQEAKNIFLNLTEIIQTSLTCSPSFMQVSLKGQFIFIYSLSYCFKPCALFFKSSAIY